MITEETAIAQTSGPEKPKASKKPRVGEKRAHVAPKKGKSGKKAALPKKAPKAAKRAEGAREGSKAGKILELLKQPEGGHAR
jgi:hypothetical protein